MNARSTIQKLTFATLSLAAFGGAAFAMAPAAAHAEDGSTAGTGILRSTDGGNTWEATATDGIFNLTFEGQTTTEDDLSLSLNFEKYKTTYTEYGKDGAKGGNVEFEWKVEEGES